MAEPRDAPRQIVQFVEIEDIEVDRVLEPVRRCPGAAVRDVAVIDA
jgi:hypothetical protein